MQIYQAGLGQCYLGNLNLDTPGRGNDGMSFFKGLLWAIGLVVPFYVVLYLALKWRGLL